MERPAIRHKERHMVNRMRDVRNDNPQAPVQSGGHGSPLQESSEGSVPETTPPLLPGPKQYSKTNAPSQRPHPPNLRENSEHAHGNKENIQNIPRGRPRFPEREYSPPNYKNSP